MMTTVDICNRLACIMNMNKDDALSCIEDLHYELYDESNSHVRCDKYKDEGFCSKCYFETTCWK